MRVRHPSRWWLPLFFMLAATTTAIAQSSTGIPSGSALGGQVGRLWVDDTPNTELTLLAFRFSSLRPHRLGFDLEAAYATGGDLDGIDLTVGTAFHLPLSAVSLLFGLGVNVVAAGGGDDAGGALGGQLGGTVLLPLFSGAGLRADLAYRRYFTGGDGFNAGMVGVGFTSLPRRR